MCYMLQITTNIYILSAVIKVRTLNMSRFFDLLLDCLLKPSNSNAMATCYFKEHDAFLQLLLPSLI